MDRLMSLSRKLAVVLIYILTFLGFFQLRTIIFSPSMKNVEILLLCIILSCVVSYTNGFTLFKGPFPKKR